MTTPPVDPQLTGAEAIDEQLNVGFDLEDDLEEAEVALQVEEMLAIEPSQKLPVTEATLEIIDVEEDEAEALAVAAVGRDPDRQLEALVHKADREPSLDETLRLRARRALIERER